MHVLLLEPDGMLAKSYVAALEAAAVSVQRVSTAHAAIQVADARVPDVVVLDMALPRHNGIEFLYEFRSYSEWRAVPVLLLVSQLERHRLDMELLTTQLGVSAVFVKSQLTLATLCEAVLSTGQEA